MHVREKNIQAYRLTNYREKKWGFADYIAQIVRFFHEQNLFQHRSFLSQYIYVLEYQETWQIQMYNKDRGPSTQSRITSDDKSNRTCYDITMSLLILHCCLRVCRNNCSFLIKANLHVNPMPSSPMTRTIPSKCDQQKYRTEPSQPSVMVECTHTPVPSAHTNESWSQIFGLGQLCKEKTGSSWREWRSRLKLNWCTVSKRKKFFMYSVHDSPPILP